jgi:hypothetical protein
VSLGVAGAAANAYWFLSGNGSWILEGATADGFEYTEVMDDPVVDANVARVRQFSATYDPASLASSARRCDTVTVTGIVINRDVNVSLGVSPDTSAGLCAISGTRASAANTVEICWINASAVGACDTASSTIRVSQPAGPA